MALSVVTITDLFQGIAQADMEGIARLFTERKYSKGATIFERGDRGDALYVVKEGLVKLASHSGRGTVTILHLLPPGAIFGEILLSEERRLTWETDPPEQEIGDIPVHDDRSEPGYLPVPDRLEGGSVRGDRRPNPATGSRSVTASPRTLPG